jgi:hypothetical protein
MTSPSWIYFVKLSFRVREPNGKAKTLSSRQNCKRRKMIKCEEGAGGAFKAHSRSRGLYKD